MALKVPFIVEDIRFHSLFPDEMPGCVLTEVPFQPLSDLCRADRIAALWYSDCSSATGQLEGLTCV